MYVDDILLANSDLVLLHETKETLSWSFDTNDLGEASFAFEKEIHKDKTRKLLGLSQQAYVDCVLAKFNMQQF